VESNTRRDVALGFSVNVNCRRHPARAQVVRESLKVVFGRCLVGKMSVTVDRRVCSPLHDVKEHDRCPKGGRETLGDRERRLR